LELSEKKGSLGNWTSFATAVGVFPEHVYDFKCPLQVSKKELLTWFRKSPQADTVSTAHTCMHARTTHTHTQTHTKTHTDTIPFPGSCRTHSGCYK
jgi:pyrroloquinoline quinone (PQQ) biosynthesis protein C